MAASSVGSRYHRTMAAVHDTIDRRVARRWRARSELLCAGVLTIGVSGHMLWLGPAVFGFDRGSVRVLLLPVVGILLLLGGMVMHAMWRVSRSERIRIYDATPSPRAGVPDEETTMALERPVGTRHADRQAVLDAARQRSRRPR